MRQTTSGMCRSMRLRVSLLRHELGLAHCTFQISSVTSVSKPWLEGVPRASEHRNRPPNLCRQGRLGQASGFLRGLPPRLLGGSFQK